MNNEVKKVLFIVNKYAGAGFQPEVEGLMIDACEARDIECTIEFFKEIIMFPASLLLLVEEIFSIDFAFFIHLLIS